jgi:hypothetical protein
MTKGKYIKALHSIGVRRGQKQGATVSLEHLKTVDVINLYFKHFEK